MNNPSTLSELKKFFDNYTLIADKVIVHRSAGTLELRKMFFYTMGRTSEQMVEQVHKALENAGISNVGVYTHGKIWNEWPKDSYWFVVVKL